MIEQSRTNSQLRAGKQIQDCSGEQMCSRVSENVETLQGLRQHRLNLKSFTILCFERESGISTSRPLTRAAKACLAASRSKRFNFATVTGAGISADAPLLSCTLISPI